MFSCDATRAEPSSARTCPQLANIREIPAQIRFFTPHRDNDSGEVEAIARFGLDHRVKLDGSPLITFSSGPRNGNVREGMKRHLIAGTGQTGFLGWAPACADGASADRCATGAALRRAEYPFATQ